MEAQAVELTIQPHGQAQAGVQNYPSSLAGTS